MGENLPYELFQSVREWDFFYPFVEEVASHHFRQIHQHINRQTDRLKIKKHLLSPGEVLEKKLGACEVTVKVTTRCERLECSCTNVADSRLVFRPCCTNNITS